MNRGREWAVTDRAGGAVDRIIAELRSVFENLWIERLVCTHPGDDDNVWFIANVLERIDVQLDSGLNGAPPFLLESDYERERTDEPGVAIEVLTTWLRGGFTQPGCT